MMEYNKLIDSNLRGASELGDSATDLHNIAFICRGDGARIVPYFYFDRAGSIRQRGVQKRRKKIRASFLPDFSFLSAGR